MSVSYAVVAANAVTDGFETVVVMVMADDSQDLQVVDGHGEEAVHPDAVDFAFCSLAPFALVEAAKERLAFDVAAGLIACAEGFVAVEGYEVGAVAGAGWAVDADGSEAFSEMVESEQRIPGVW